MPSRPKSTAKREWVHSPGREHGAPTEAEVMERMREIPANDTRSFTSRLMGDPVVERSALGMKQK